jgi:phosphomannomutase
MAEDLSMPPSPLVVSYSGVRGVVGESLTAEVAERFGDAFGQMVSQRYPGQARILIGRDTRPSGPMLREGLIRGLAAHPARIIELGIVPTPTVQFGLGAFSAQAGAVITASHNPLPWNGFKFFLAPENMVLDGAQTAELFRRFEGSAPTPHPVPAAEQRHDEAIALHVQRVLRQVDVEAIRARRLRVAMDPGRGAGEEPALALLRALGAETVLVTTERESEPVPEQLVALTAAVRAHRCDVGFAQDLDGDRLALVTEEGVAPGEDYTLVLVVDHLLQRPEARQAVVVKNVATTMALDEVAARRGASIVETRVGEVNLSRALMKLVAEGRYAIGGEGNGGIIFPPVVAGRDSIVGMALVLEALARGPQTLGQRLRALPSLHTRKAKLAVPAGIPITELYRRVAAAFAHGAVDHIDGIRLRFPDGSWFGVRPSNTEPVLRIMAESRSALWIDDTVARVQALLTG